MNYKIITDKEKLLEFIDWLPEPLRNEKFYVTLLTRKKYNPLPHMKADTFPLRKLCVGKSRMFEKIWQMECPIGAYRSDGFVVPQENLALYVTPNPRDVDKAGIFLQYEMAKRALRKQNIVDCHTLAMSQIHSTPGRKIFHDVDVDVNKGFDIDKTFTLFKEKVASFVNMSALSYIRTNGGFHCLIRLSEVEEKYRKTWFINISKMKCEEFDVTMNKYEALPMPGCVQGPFTPQLIK